MKAATQSLYERLLRAPDKLTWSEIFQGLRDPHSREDADFAMIAGTTLDSVNDEIGMLQKWQRPWLCRRVLLAGIASSVALFCALVLMILVFGNCAPALFLLYFILPPCVVPVTLMVFFWEMNVPRNISLVDMIRYFFTGGVLSIVATFLLSILDGSTVAWLAPVTEEPAKLIVSLFFLTRLRKKNGRLYGLNGLAIGAAVGAGFAAFESAQYAYGQYSQVIAMYAQSQPGAFLEYTILGQTWFDTNSIILVTSSILIRSLCAINSHVLYCAPYAAMAALFMGDGMSMPAALQQISFIAVFMVSFFSHMLWNMLTDMVFWPMLVAVTLVVWLNARYAMRRSFAQLASRVPASGGSAPITSLRIQGVSGIHGGILFQITRDEILVGSDPACRLNYPVNTPDVDPMHCKLLVRNGGVYLADLGSRSGTWLNGVPCKPSKGYLLQPGDTFYLGSPDQSFRAM